LYTGIRTESFTFGEDDTEEELAVFSFQSSVPMRDKLMLKTEN